MKIQDYPSIGYSFATRQCTCRWGIVLCAFVLGLPFSTHVWADDENFMDYRRIFVSEDQIDNSFFPLPILPVNRQEFEHKLALLEQQSEEQSGTQPNLSKIVLKAKLEGRQLVSGQGFFTLHPRSDHTDSIPLHPLTLAVNSLRWSDEIEALFFCEPNGENRLLVPSETDSNAYDQLQFRWSLQSRNDYRNGIIFDFALPPCLSIELQLDLPDSMVLTASSGLVLLDEENVLTEPEIRTWRVLLGHHSDTALTITSDKTLPSSRPSPSIRQATSYIITPQGLETQSRVIFDRADSRLEELLLELETPLRPVEVRYGDQPVVWTMSAISPDVTEIHIDLSPFTDEDPQDLQIRSLGPLRENQRWMLPRVRVTSSDIFWMENRCGVSVYPPLRTRNLFSHRAVQVTPRSVFEWSERELYVFQFFQDDAQIELDVVYSTPLVSISSATQLYWSDNEISGTVYLECSVTEGERFTFSCPVSEHWIIDSVSAYPQSGAIPIEGDLSLPWDVLDDGTQTLSVQLNRPLQPRRSVMLQLTCRFINSSQTQFRLADLSPLVLSHWHGESHHIAVQQDLTASQLKFDREASTFNVPQTLTIGGNSLTPMGNVYPLNSRTQDIRFDLERMRPNYSAVISGNIYVGNDTMTSTFRIHCTPTDSSMSRVFIHFTPTGEEHTHEQWDWSLIDSDSTRTFRVFRSSPADVKALLLASEQQNWGDELDSGELWEIRFDESQTTPFELSAVSFIPLADSISIPFASVPLASAQKGELTIESPQHFDYQITGARLDSIPTAPAVWDRYQHVRAAFRYDPAEELRRSQRSPLLLQRLTSEEQIDTAWVWSLRLDSQHDPEGTVQNRALFLVENHGKDTLKITLPHGINVADVFAVWVDLQQIPWQYDNERRTIDVALPVGQRFVSVTVEYSYHDTPLIQQRKLRPRYPTTDIPTLSGNWISWFPPEFDVSLRHADSGTEVQSALSIPLSKTLDYLLTGTYRSFIGTMWDDFFYSEQRRLDAEAAAKCVFMELAVALQKNSNTTWGTLIGDEKILSAIRLRLENDNARRAIDTKFFIDKQALAFLGITPTTPIAANNSISEGSIREKLFENAGLVLLIAAHTRSDGIKEYVFALTTPTTLSLNRQFQSVPAGHCVRVVPSAIFDPLTQSSQWLTPARWLSETTLSSIPWSISTQAMQRSSFTSDWNAFELPINAEQPLYIVHRQKFTALQWIAFLSVVLLTCRRPLSSPIVLFFLLIIFEIIAWSVAPCYIGIPSGAFLGVLVSFAFVLIRSQVNPNEPPPESHPPQESTECSVSFVKMPLTVRGCLLCGLLSVFSGTFASAQILSEPQETIRKEPYHVIYPTDSKGRDVGQDVLVPWEFITLLHNKIKTDVPATVPQWNIIKATYQGSLIRSPSGYLECSDDFKAVYDIYLDSPSAIITLPNLPVVQGRFSWNARPIQPIWSDDMQSNALSFAITNETPGKHVLEIAFSPKAVLQNDDDMYQIAFAIPKVPDSTLRLAVPQDTPPISVSNALGAVTANTPLSPILTAELGATQQLSLSWFDEPNQNGALVNEVEQFFRMRVKPLRIELETLFRFRIDNGSIRSLTIRTDPRWSISGQFQCDEHPITQRSETSPDSFPFGDLAVSPLNTSRIDFPSPVSGKITLRAVFVFTPWADPIRPEQRFYGMGNLRLPEFSVSKSQVTKSMLAVYADDPLLELDFPADGRSTGFETGWQATTPLIPSLFRDVPFLDIAGTLLTGQNEATPDAEYDLLVPTESDWTLNIHAKKNIPDVAVSQSVQFDAGESRVHLVGEFTAISDVFQQYFSTAHPIRIETLEVRDSQDIVVESRFLQTDPETMPEQYIVLFKRPVTEKYTITIQGFFVSDIQEALSLQSVPDLIFDDAQTTEYSLNLFRTSAAIAEIPPEQNGWAKLNALPSTHESFSPSIPLGTWKRVESSESDSPGAQAEALQFTLSLNRPNVKCKTLLSLQVDADDIWTLTLDFTANVTDGELRTLYFQWDERYGTIQPTESVASLSLDQSQQRLTVSLNEPIRGEQHVKIIVSLNTSGAVSLPNIFPLAGRTEQFDSEIYVNLPLRQDNEIIPWDLNQLMEIEELEPEPQRLVLRATENNFSAVINRDEAKLTATFYDIGFLIRHAGTILGVATIDLRNRGQDHFVLQMPEGYQLIQISSAGLLLGRARFIENNRWQINIGTSGYPQRLNILFRASIPQPLKQWNREQIVSTLQFPQLEGVVVQETIWTVAMEGSTSPLNVAMVQESDGKEKKLGEHTPITGIDVTLSLIGMNLIREDNLLRVLQSLSVSLRQEEIQYWFLHWLAEWNMVADKVDFQISHLPLTLHNVRPKLITQSTDSDSEKTNVRSFLERMGAQTPSALKVFKEQIAQEKFGQAMDSLASPPVPILTSQVYWQGRVTNEVQYLFGTEEGAIRAIRLTSVPSAGAWLPQFSGHPWLWISLALLIPVFVLLSVRWVYLSELWLQFPHFWGMTIGVLLWIFLAESFIGPIVIVLTFLSLFRPSWTRHRFRMYS